MKNLLEFLQRHYHWLLFAVLEVVSFVLLFQYNSYQGSVWLSSANAVAGWCYQWSSAVQSYFTLHKVNDDLARRNFYLERRVALMRERLQEAGADSTQLPDSLRHYEVLAAKVVSNEVDRLDNLLTIDKGRADGVEVGMGVVSGTGVVGVTYMVSDHYTVVIPILNSHSSRISCAIRDRGYFGVLRWYGGDAGHAYVEDIPRHARFKVGEWVETNGYSSIFPPGVLVGKIVTVYNSRDGLSYRLKVRLSTDFGTLRNVLVITDRSIEERMRLKQAAADSIKLNVKE